MRAVRNGMTYSNDDRIVLDYKLVSRGNEEVWVRDENAPLGYRPEVRPIFLKYAISRTTTRPLGYVLPPSMAKVVPLLQDHGNTVQRSPRTSNSNSGIRRDRGRHGLHPGPLPEVGQRRKSTGTSGPGRLLLFSTAQSHDNLIAYIMGRDRRQPDHLGYTDHVLRVTASRGRQQRDRSPPPATSQRVPMMRGA